MPLDGLFRQRAAIYSILSHTPILQPPLEYIYIVLYSVHMIRAYLENNRKSDYYQERPSKVLAWNDAYCLTSSSLAIQNVKDCINDTRYSLLGTAGKVVVEQARSDKGTFGKMIDDKRIEDKSSQTGDLTLIYLALESYHMLQAIYYRGKLKEDLSICIRI